MTVNHVQNKALEILAIQDTISISEIKLSLSEQIKEEDVLEALIVKALEGLEELKLINKLVLTDEQTKKESYLWVLNKPLTSFNQNIEIDGVLAAAIAQIINRAADLVSDKKSSALCNAMDINSKDIETLIFIADQVLSEKEDGFDEFHLPDV